MHCFLTHAKGVGPEPSTRVDVFVNMADDVM